MICEAFQEPQEMLDLRLATISDIEAIASLTTGLAREFIAPDCTDEGARHLLNSMSEQATRERFDSGYRYIVAIDGGRLVGVVATRDDRHLYHLFVAGSHHRRGIAKQLWDVARQACVAAGNPGQFTVNSSRCARGVYERLGFVPEAETVMNGVPFIPMTLSTTETLPTDPPASR